MRLESASVHHSYTCKVETGICDHGWALCPLIFDVLCNCLLSVWKLGAV